MNPSWIHLGRWFQTRLYHPALAGTPPEEGNWNHLGGLSACFWQQNSAESVRINAMFYFTEQIRGELYAQIQTMIRARVLQDSRALPSARPACGRPDFPQDRALSCISARPIQKKPLYDQPHAVSVS